MSAFDRVLQSGLQALGFDALAHPERLIVLLPLALLPLIGLARGERPVGACVR